MRKVRNFHPNPFFERIIFEGLKDLAHDHHFGTQFGPPHQVDSYAPGWLAFKVNLYNRHNLATITSTFPRRVSEALLKKGGRIILDDMPDHPRSPGRPAYVPEEEPEGVTVRNRNIGVRNYPHQPTMVVYVWHEEGDAGLKYFKAGLKQIESHFEEQHQRSMDNLHHTRHAHRAGSGKHQR